MNRNILLGLSLAAAMAAGVAAQSSPQDPKTNPDERQVTVLGCLERDHLYNPNTMGDGAAGTLSTTSSSDIAPTPYKLTHVRVIKDLSSMTSMKGNPNDAVLHVVALTQGQLNLDLDAQVDHTVELVGTTSSKDMTTKMPPQILKVMSVQWISDKCQ
jgi:hypothetical protein